MTVLRNLYGKLNCSAVPKDVLDKIIAWMRSDYCEKLLTKDQVVDWANVLASYWYPKLNTDIVDLNGQTLWPNKDTENEFKRELKGLVVKDPLVVIRAKPFGKSFIMFSWWIFLRMLNPLKRLRPIPEK